MKVIIKLTIIVTKVRQEKQSEKHWSWSIPQLMDVSSKTMEHFYIKVK